MFGDTYALGADTSHVQQGSGEQEVGNSTEGEETPLIVGSDKSSG